MLLCLLTADWRIRAGGISTFDLLRLPDEILEQIALVLGQEEMLRLLNDISEIGDETSTFGRELCRRVGKSARVNEAVQCDVDLLILVPYG